MGRASLLTQVLVILSQVDASQGSVRLAPGDPGRDFTGGASRGPAARTRCLHEGVPGLHAPALPELPPGRRLAAAGRRQPRARPVPASPRRRRERRLRDELQQLSPGDQRAGPAHAPGAPQAAAEGGLPAAPRWHLPGSRVADGFPGQIPRQLCRQLKDPRQNGGLTPDRFLHHVTTDPLVLWAWDPGEGRTSPPLSHGNSRRR